eukprot:3328130-Prymnesium_polylepis.2
MPAGSGRVPKGALGWNHTGTSSHALSDAGTFLAGLLWYSVSTFAGRHVSCSTRSGIGPRALGYPLGGRAPLGWGTGHGAVARRAVARGSRRWAVAV